MSLDFEREKDARQLIRDTRRLPQRVTSWLRVPENIAILMSLFAVLAFFLPGMALIAPLLLEPVVVLGLVFAYWSYRAQGAAGLPLRFPKSSGVIDPNELHPATGAKLPAEGIVYLGNDMDTGEEIWLSDTMARTHMMFLGTTGSGKALSDDARVLTPSGWRRLGDMVVGDILCLPGGGTTTILGVYPQGRKAMHGIELANGRRSACCDEHLWLIKHAGEERVARTDELLELSKTGETFELPCTDVVAAADGYAATDSRWSAVTRMTKGPCENATCILVDSKEHLFITGDLNGDRSAGIVTHNTEFLLSVVYNALIHGSGFIYVDGKADSSLYGKIYSMARQMGREDDVRVINFQTGAKDIFGPQPFKMSNTVNPFAVGSAGMLTNLVVSLMSSGKGDVWENRAISFVEALMKPLVFLRDRYGLMLDVELIRDYFDLKRLEDLTWRDEDKYPGLEEALGGMRSYLTNLPTYDRAKHHKQGETAYEQHGYITMQLVRTFNSLADTYGYIMKTPLAEIDFLDVFLNRRILVVLLPALEKSSSELQNLGKIIVASIKATMAVGLGSRLEGSWAQVLDSKPTNAPSPFMCVLDEYGYYAVEGFAVVPAQARSLGFSAIFAGQDLPAFQKSSEKEADSTLANTNTKLCGKLICTKTAKYFTEYSGQGTFTRASGFEADTGGGGGFKDTNMASIEKMDRVTLDDLMKQETGRWTLWFGRKIIRVKSFYSSPSKVQTLRVNRMLRVARPQPAAVDFYRAANRAFMEAVAHPEGLSSAMDSVPIHDLMVVAEGLQKFNDTPGFEQALCALTHYTREATHRTEAFDRMLETIRSTGHTGTRSFGDDPDAVNGADRADAAADAEEDDADYERDSLAKVNGYSAGTPNGFSDRLEVKSNDAPFNAGLSVMGDVDFSGEGNMDADQFELEDLPLTQEGTLVEEESTFGTEPEQDLPETESAGWDTRSRFDGESVRADLFSRDNSDIEPFAGADIYGLTEALAGFATETSDGDAVARVPRKRANPEQGQLDREYTEASLQRIERLIGATEDEASLSASISGSKLADITKYPLTKPPGKVTPELFTEIARRLSRGLDVQKDNGSTDER